MGLLLVDTAFLPPSFPTPHFSAQAWQHPSVSVAHAHHLVVPQLIFFLSRIVISVCHLDTIATDDSDFNEYSYTKRDAIHECHAEHLGRAISASGCKCNWR